MARSPHPNTAPWHGVFTYLVFVAGALAILCETFQSLVDEGYVLLVDVQSQ